MFEQRTIYRAFKVECHRRGFKLKQVASRLNVTEATLRNYLTGHTKMTEEFMAVTAEYLDVDVFVLFPESRLIQYILSKSKATTRK